MWQFSPLVRLGSSRTISGVTPTSSSSTHWASMSDGEESQLRIISVTGVTAFCPLALTDGEERAMMLRVSVIRRSWSRSGGPLKRTCGTGVGERTGLPHRYSRRTHISIVHEVLLKKKKKHETPCGWLLHRMELWSKWERKDLHSRLYRTCLQGGEVQGIKSDGVRTVSCFVDIFI